jgi:hypothetical protein
MKHLPKSQRSDRVTDQLLAEATAGLGSDRRNTTVEQWALLSGLHGLYSTAYASLSFHVHPSLVALSGMVGQDGSREISISARPHMERLPLAVLSASDGMVDAMSALPEGYASAEHLAAIGQLRQMIEDLYRGLPDLELVV